MLYLKKINNFLDLNYEAGKTARETNKITN